MQGVDFITVSDEVRARWKQAGVNLEGLDERLNDINLRIRALLMSLAGRDIKVQNKWEFILSPVPNENYNADGYYDPWHDEGNGTNHRLSQCTERCK